MMPMISMYPLVSHWVSESLMSRAAEMLGRAVASAVLIMDVAVQITTMLRKITFLLRSVTSRRDISAPKPIGISTFLIFSIKSRRISELVVIRIIRAKFQKLSG